MTRMHLAKTFLLSLITLGMAACTAPVPPAKPANTARPELDPVVRGDYLVRIGGCNDCHTPGYGETGGNIPKAQWLVGSPLGWFGPWGTTYPVNLRLKLQDMDEPGWMKYSAELHARPPMPDYALRAMSEDDRRAIYRFVRSLGPAGKPAPAYVPPGQTPAPPYVQWILPSAPPSAPAHG